MWGKGKVHLLLLVVKETAVVLLRYSCLINHILIDWKLILLLNAIVLTNLSHYQYLFNED